MTAGQTANAVRLLLTQTEQKLAASKPRPPFGAFDCFQISLCREYGISETAENLQKVTGVAEQAWAALSPQERAPFENHAAEEQRRYAEELRIYEDMQTQYERLKALARAQGVELPSGADLPSLLDQQQAQQQLAQQQLAQQQAQQQAQHLAQLEQAALHTQQQLQAAQQAAQQQAAAALQLQQQLSDLQPQYAQQVAQVDAAASQLPAPLQHVYAQRQRHALAQHFQQQQQQLQQQLQQAVAAVAAARQAVQRLEWQAAQQWQQQQEAQQEVQQWQQRRAAQQRQRQEVAALAQQPKRAKLDNAADEEEVVIPDGIPETIEVSCQGVSGTMYVLAQQVVCHCKRCQGLPPERRLMSCPQFETHTGASSAKKWKTSLRVVPGGAPGVPLGGSGMQVGRWLELNAVNFSRPVQSLGSQPVARPPAPHPPAPPPEKTYASERLAQKMQEREREREAERQREAELREAEHQADRAGSASARGRPSMQRQQGGDGDGAGRDARLLRGLAPGEGVSMQQLGRRLPGRPPKGGVYRPERVAAALGHRAMGTPIRGGGGAPAAPAGAARVAPWLEVSQGLYRPVHVRYSGERCCVCDADTDFDFDQLVGCDCCGITVHQSCYGVAELPGPDEAWLCRACELREEGRPPPQCCVCPVTGGALKPSTIRGVWCHSACLQWIPELSVSNVLAQEPVEGVRSVPRERWDLLCCVCRQRMGAKVQCDTCFTAYHPLCARVAGFVMETRNGPEGPDGPVEFVSYCARHAAPQPHLSGMRQVSEAEQEGELPAAASSSSLDNAQPYELPARARLPKCPAGAARAMPIDRWQRQQHGTGTGASSLAGWWMPGPAHVGEGPRRRQRAVGRLCIPPGASPPRNAQAAAHAEAEGEEHAAGSVATSLGDGPGTGGSRGHGGGRGVSLGGEPQHVELMELPPGVPELLPVVCNGRRAELVLRTQRVLYRGQEMSPSRFEAMAGNHSAKKWKTSLFLCSDDGQPLQAMQDWLAERDLDRRALEALARNASLAAEYEEHVKGEVEAVMEGLLQAAQAFEPNASSAVPPAHSAALQPDTVQQAGGSGPASGEGGAAQPAAANGEAEAPNGRTRQRPQPAEDGQLHSLEPPGCAGALGHGTANGRVSAQQQGSAESRSLNGAHGDLCQEGQGQLNEEVAEYSRSVSPRAGALSAAAHEAVGREQGQDGGSAQVQPRIKQERQEGDAPPAEQATALLGRKRSFDTACGDGGAGSTDSPRVGPPSAAASAGLPRCASVEGESRGLSGEEQQPRAWQGRGVEEPGDAGEEQEGADGMVVRVVCGELQASFDARTMKVTLLNGRVLSPGEYERLSGRSASKKWKWSIRLDVGDGAGGATLAEWLAERGLEGPAGQPQATKGTSETVWRQQQAQNGSAAPASPRSRTHPPECGCIICKQARRSGKLWSGMPEAAAQAGCAEGGAPGGGLATRLATGAREGLPDASAQAPDASEAAAEQGSLAVEARTAPQWQEPAGSLRRAAAAPSGGPRTRDGKRAYLSALPQLATAGPTPHQLHELPLSRCWTPEDWVAQKRRQAALAESRALQAQGRPPRSVDAGTVAGFGGNTWADSLAPKVSLGPGVHDWRLCSVREKLELCAATERARIAFGKSGIHGWGLFARVPLRQDTMIAEYRGVLVRASAAEAREARYRAQGRDCYLFNLDDAHVLDATQAGAISRFTNHSCSPSMYSKILNVDGRQRLVFFARQDIEAGQELTFNYRFERAEGEERLQCSCGAPNCTGFLN